MGQDNRGFQAWLGQVAEQSDVLNGGLMLLQWEAIRDKGTNAGTWPDDPRSLRVMRLLRSVALRFEAMTNTVIAWHQSDLTLLLHVSLSDETVSLEKLNYLVRELVVRLFAGRPLQKEGEGLIRCGYAPIRQQSEASKDRREPPRGIGSPVAFRLDRALLAAWGDAWKRSSAADAVIHIGKSVQASDEPLWNQFEIRYAPIVSLLDGTVYGYEAMPYRRSTGQRWPAEEMFAEAAGEGTLYECDRRFREAAIRGLTMQRGGVKLFLPIPASVIYDSRLYPGTTLRRIEAAGLRPEHVVLQFTCRNVQESDDTLAAALRHYRLQGFRVALSGVKPDRESLRRMALLQPDYAQVDGEWISDMNRMAGGKHEGLEHRTNAELASRAVDESLLGAMSALARKEQVVLIVGGLTSESQVGPLVSSGVAYGQGKWIGAEASATMPERVAASVTDAIRKEVKRRYRGASGALSELTMPVAAFGWETPVSEIARQFEWQREAHGFIIAEGSKPVGLLMKDKLHQLLSGQFGLPLYWNRPVGKIMDTQPMIVDESTPIDQVSQMAMAREPDKLYDAVIVTRQGMLTGIASIRALLEWVTHARMADAQWANPLTGLPGNEPIRREFMRRIGEGRPFAVLYADLDHFKWFNDRFGFHRGDAVIRYTGETLASYIRADGGGENFVGHVGGDDFVAVISSADPVGLSQQWLQQFAQGIEAYVDPQAGPVTDREGRDTGAAGLTLSLALLICTNTDGWTPERLSERAAQLKKKAKQQQGHSLMVESVDQGNATATTLHEFMEQ